MASSVFPPVRWPHYNKSAAGYEADITPPVVASIWKVEADHWLKRDMNHFIYWANPADTAGAHAYWSDKITADPFFEYLLKPPVKVLEEVVCVPGTPANSISSA
jgi:hypothetical protein